MLSIFIQIRILHEKCVALCLENDLKLSSRLDTRYDPNGFGHQLAYLQANEKKTEASTHHQRGKKIVYESNLKSRLLQLLTIFHNPSISQSSTHAALVLYGTPPQNRFKCWLLFGCSKGMLQSVGIRFSISVDWIFLCLYPHFVVRIIKPQPNMVHTMWNGEMSNSERSLTIALRLWRSRMFRIGTYFFFFG